MLTICVQTAMAFPIPMGVMLTPMAGALMPFSTVAQLARLGLVATIVCGGLAAGLAAGGTLRWSFFVTIYFVVLQLVVATVGCMVFVRVVTRLFQSWNERPLAPAGDPDRAASPSRAELVDRDSGEPHLIGIAVDVTEQMRMVERSKTADIRLRDAIETVSEAFVLWDSENRLVMCNSKYQQLHGMPDAALVPGTPYA